VGKKKKTARKHQEKEGSRKLQGYPKEAREEVKQTAYYQPPQNPKNVLGGTNFLRMERKNG